MTKRSYDVVVVGNGSVGLATARQIKLDAPDLRVLLVGPRDRAGGASTAAGAMLGCFGEVTARTLTSMPGRAKFELQLLSHQKWDPLLDELEIVLNRQIRRSLGTYVLNNSIGGPEDSDNFQAMLDAVAQYSGRALRVDGVPGLSPHAGSRPLECVYLEEEGSIDSKSYIDALLTRCLELGVEVLDAEVTRIGKSESKVDTVFVKDGSVFGAGHIVLAAGSRTTQLLDRSSLSSGVMPVLSGTGVAMVLERLTGGAFESAIRTVNRAGSCGLHLVPLSDRVEYVGATNVIFRESELQAWPGVIQFLSQCALEQLDSQLSYSRLVELRVGNRPVSLDTFPMLGPGPADNLTILTGMYRDGLHASPLLAEAAAAWVLTGDRSSFLDVFAPVRVPISVMTVEESIDAFCKAMIGSAIEAGLRPTPFLCAEDLDKVYRPQATQLYEFLGIGYGLDPDIVNYLCCTRKSTDDVLVAKRWLQTCSGQGTAGSP